MLYAIMFGDTRAWLQVNRHWVHQGNQEPLYIIFDLLGVLWELRN